MRLRLNFRAWGEDRGYIPAAYRATCARAPRRQLWDVDFSLALFNRTGKFLVGQEVLAAQADHIGKVYYWRVALGQHPRGWPAKAIGKLEAIEHRWQRHPLVRGLPRGRTSRPMLHLDPLSVLHRDLSADDMILCHDIGPITHADLFARGTGDAYAEAFDRIAKVRPRMIFVSRSSASAYSRLYGDPSWSRVIYPPLRPAVSTGEVSPLAGIAPPFLLTVGSLGRRKNQLTAIAAFARSGLVRQGIHYVLCGPREPGAEAVLAAARVTPGVHCLPYVTDAELRWLYSRAAAFVLPSLLEGFGMPVAEAMRNGLVPIVSRTSVLEEVTGECGIAVDPHSEEEIAAAMVECVERGSGRRDDTSRMQAQLERFAPSEFHARWQEALIAAPTSLAVLPADTAGLPGYVHPSASGSGAIS